MKTSKQKFMVAAVAAMSVGTLAQAGEFATAAYTTPLADVCPNPLVIQKDWLMQAEHGGFIQMIGSGGEMASGVYSGPLGSTGITLEILEGGGGIGLGDGETSYSALFMGNSKAGKRPHMAYHELDNSYIYSERFPTVGVFVPLDKTPQVLFWDKATYPDGFETIDDLIKFGESGAGKIYLSTIDRTFGKFFVDSGVAEDTFVEGYRGDGENFVVNNGTWLNQGFVTSEVIKFEKGNNWAKPIGSVGISDLGYPNYTGLLAVAKVRLDELTSCLEKVVPIMQQAAIDYIKDPAEVLEVVVAFNEGGFGTGWWKTSPELVASAVKIMGESGLVGNGSNDTVGDFDMSMVAAMRKIVGTSLDERSNMDVVPEDIVTNRFIDPSIGF
jgi:hypothetical protein